MKISDFLSPAHVMIDVRACEKRRLLEQLSTEAAVGAGLVAGEVVREIVGARISDRPASAMVLRFPTRGFRG
jgi:hypothetical protein